MESSVIRMPTRLAPYSATSAPTFLGVVDTCALLSSVRNDVKHGPSWRSRLLRTADGQTAVLYASDHVYAEVYRRLPKIARTTSISVEVLRQRFEETYLPALRFVTVSKEASDDPQVLAITDPDDVPTGKLAKLIAPCVVFSEDKHLRRPGLAPDQWREIAKAGADLVEARSLQDANRAVLKTTSHLASLSVTGARRLVKMGAQQLTFSPWLLSGIIVGGAMFLLRTPSRREQASRYLAALPNMLMANYEHATQLEQRGLHDLRQVMLSAPVSPSTRQQIAIVLSRRQEPLLAREIHKLIRQHFSNCPIPTLGEVRTVLNEGSEFVQPEQYRWSFGRQVGPWQGSYESTSSTI